MTQELQIALTHYLTFWLTLCGVGYFLSLSEPRLGVTQRLAIGAVIATAWPWFAYRGLRRLFNHLARPA